MSDVCNIEDDACNIEDDACNIEDDACNIEDDACNIEVDTDGWEQIEEFNQTIPFEHDYIQNSCVPSVKLSEEEMIDLLLAESDEAGPSNINVADQSDDVAQEIDLNQLNSLLAVNEAFDETLDNLIRRVSIAISKNRETQSLLKAKLKQAEASSPRLSVKKVPLSRFMYPYFCDAHYMEPPKNTELLRKLKTEPYDPLIKEDKRWSNKDLTNLHVAVRKSMIEVRIQPFLQRKQIFKQKIKDCGQETSKEQIHEWETAVSEQERMIQYHKNMPVEELMIGDFSEVDWIKIAKVDFHGSRTPRQIRLKWINEQCPRWNKNSWDDDELQRLRDAASYWNNWDAIAEELKTNRTPFQCFLKFKSDLEVENVGKYWTKEEDAQLMVLVHCMQENGKQPWDKIAYHMEERTRHQCAIRYRRALDTNIKSGRWDKNEDLLLTCAVGRFGIKQWLKVAELVPGRSDSQCRDRWVNILDKSINNDPWSLQEDEKLLEGIKIFGKGEWSRIASIIPGRTSAHCKSRFRTLVSAKIQIEYKFKELLKSDCGDDLAEQIVASFNMRSLSADEIEVLSNMPTQQREAVVEFLKDVQQKNISNPNSSIWQLLNDKLSLDPGFLDGQTRNLVLRYYRRFLCDEQNNVFSKSERNRFEVQLVVARRDEEKREIIMNSMLNMVERYDIAQHEKAEKKLTRNHHVKMIKQYLIDRLITGVDSCQQIEELSPLPPFLASVKLLEKIRKTMRTFNTAALNYFNPIHPEAQEPLIRLSKSVLHHPDYIAFYIKMRNLFFLPMLLARSIESEGSASKRVEVERIAEGSTSDLVSGSTGAVRHVGSKKQIPISLSMTSNIVKSVREVYAGRDDDSGPSVGDILRKICYKQGVDRRRSQRIDDWRHSKMIDNSIENVYKTMTKTGAKDSASNSGSDRPSNSSEKSKSSLSAECHPVATRSSAPTKAMNDESSGSCAQRDAGATASSEVANKSVDTAVSSGSSFADESDRSSGRVLKIKRQQEDNEETGTRRSKRQKMNED